MKVLAVTCSFILLITFIGMTLWPIIVCSILIFGLGISAWWSILALVINLVNIWLVYKLFEGID